MHIIFKYAKFVKYWRICIYAYKYENMLNMLSIEGVAYICTSICKYVKYAINIKGANMQYLLNIEGVAYICQYAYSQLQIVIKYLQNTDQIRQYDDQILIKIWSNTTNCWAKSDEILMKIWPNTHQILIEIWSYTGQIRQTADQNLIKYWSNTNQILIKIWSKKLLSVIKKRPFCHPDRKAGVVLWFGMCESVNGLPIDNVSEFLLLLRVIL